MRVQYTVEETDLIELLNEASFVIGFLGAEATIAPSERTRQDMKDIAARLRAARDRVVEKSKARPA